MCQNQSLEYKLVSHLSRLDTPLDVLWMLITAMHCCLFAVLTPSWSLWWCGRWCCWQISCSNSDLSTCGHAGSSLGACTPRSTATGWWATCCVNDRNPTHLKKCIFYWNLMLFFLQVICVVFVCAAFTLDIFCLIFVPLHWLFFVASTYVLFNYIWHTGEYLIVLYHTHDKMCFVCSGYAHFFYELLTMRLNYEWFDRIKYIWLLLSVRREGHLYIDGVLVDSARVHRGFASTQRP